MQIDVYAAHGGRELRIVADLETLDPMRLQPVTVPDSTHAGLADAHRRRHAARAPVGGVRRLLPRCHVHHTPRKTSGDLGRTTGPGRISLQTSQAQSEEPLAPAQHLLGSDLQGSRDFLVLSAFGGPSNTMRARSTARAGSDRPRARCCKATRWSGLKVIAGAIRIRWLSC